MIKFLPRVRAWDPFSVKHPLMNDQYLFARRGKKQEDGHNGTTRITVSFCKSGAKKSVPDVPKFRKCENNLWSFAGQ